ncbi:hypothetical protein [Sagittula sp. SSi028]|uniref:hypothetical protein n=1 Tax=Sagittula sp. SSi028 TaxID=3400636 RepID=UPI003AF4A821
MASKIFDIDTREDGTGRLSLGYRGAGGGLRRLSFDLSRADLVQLALFSEAASLRDDLGMRDASDLDFDGLWISDDPVAGQVHLRRVNAYSEQEAQVPREVFHAETAGAMDICLAQAEQVKHGDLLKQMLSETDVPLPDGLPDDAAEALTHRLREMALLLLAEQLAEKGSPLAKLMRAKKTRPEAEVSVARFTAALARSLLPGAVSQRAQG